MSPSKRELRLGMIKSGNLQPGIRGMTGGATLRRAIGQTNGHYLGELAFVWILMTGGAAPILKAVFYSAQLCSGFLNFMTIRANDRNMRACEGKSGGIVLRQSQQRRPEALHVVAILAAIFMWRRGELAFMNICMASGTLHILDGKNRVRAFRYVTLRAGHRSVFSFKRILCLRMLLHPECGRLEAVDGMTVGAFRAEVALGKLPAMWIGQMAINTLLKRNRSFEIACFVAPFAGHDLMTAKQRKGGF